MTGSDHDQLMEGAELAQQMAELHDAGIISDLTYRSVIRAIYGAATRSRK